MIALLTIVYSFLFRLGWKYRNTIAFKARSPKLLALGVLFLYFDSIGNTLIFTGNSG